MRKIQKDDFRKS